MQIDMKTIISHVREIPRHLFNRPKSCECYANWKRTPPIHMNWDALVSEITTRRGESFSRDQCANCMCEKPATETADVR